MRNPSRSTGATGATGPILSLDAAGATGAIGPVSAAAIEAARPAPGTGATGASEAAAGAVIDGRPQDAARAAEAVAGTARDAPSVGSGPVGERFPEAADIERAIAADPRTVDRSLMGGFASGGVIPGGFAVEAGAGRVEPQIMSREGAFGAAPERRAMPTVATLLARRAALATDVAEIAVTGAKLARHMPTTDDELDELREAGFDLVVISRQAGFRRAGVAHPTAPTLRRSQDFEVHEIEALARDPMLVVQGLR